MWTRRQSALVDLEFGPSPRPFFESDPALGRARPLQTGVDPMTEAESHARNPVHVEAVRLIELTLVPCGGAGEQQYRDAGRDRHAVEFAVADRETTLVLRGGQVPKHLLDGVRDP